LLHFEPSHHHALPDQYKLKSLQIEKCLFERKWRKDCGLARRFVKLLCRAEVPSVAKVEMAVFELCDMLEKG
jgi:hypothetical protein